MAFTIDGIVIDRVLMGFAETTAGEPLYVLNQLQEATINITAESKEARDATGTLIKKFYTGKSGTFEAQNALIDFNVLAESAGSPKQVAGEDSAIVMPGIKTVSVGTESVTLNGLKADSTISVIGIAPNGTMSTAYTKDTSASETAFSVDGEVVSLPTATDVANFVVKYERDVTAGIKVINRSDKFPRTIKLTLQALAIDPCDPSTVRSCLIVMPSFQVSPETSLALTTESTLNFNGDLQTSYCGTEKETDLANLYN